MTSKVEEIALMNMNTSTEPTLAQLVLMILRKRADEEALRRGLLADSHHPVHPIDRAEVRMRPEMKPDGDAQRGWIEPSSQNRSKTSDLAFDAMMNTQDRLDRAARAAELAKLKGGGKHE